MTLLKCRGALVVIIAIVCGLGAAASDTSMDDSVDQLLDVTAGTLCPTAEAIRSHCPYGKHLHQLNYCVLYFCGRECVNHLPADRLYSDNEAHLAHNQMFYP